MTDGFVAPIWLAVNATLLWAGWRVSSRLYPEANLAQRVSQTVLIWWGCVVLTGILVGSLGWLSGTALLVVGGGLAASLLWLLRPRVVPVISTRSGSGSDAFEKQGGGRTASDGRTNPRDCFETGQSSQVERVFLILWGCWLAYALGRVVTGGLLRHPSDWDTLMYHLPLINQWLQAKSLYATGDAVWYNPASNELVGLWMVAPFSGDFLFALNNIPAVILLVTGCLELGAQLKLDVWFRHITTLAIVSNYVVFRQMLDAKNDVTVLSLFVTTLAFGLRFTREGRSSALVYAGVAFGILCGVKYYAVGYAGAVWLTLVTLAWGRRGRRAALEVGLALVLGAIILAGYWYGRNAWVTGTPVYPKGITRNTDKVLQVRPELWQTTFLGSERPETFPLAIQAVRVMAGPCHSLAILALPVVLAWLIASGVLACRNDAGWELAQIRWSLAFLTLSTGVILGLTPFAVETIPGTMNMLRSKYLPVRFGLCFLTMSLTGIAILFQDVSYSLQALAAKISNYADWNRGNAVTVAFRLLLVLSIVPMVIYIVGAVYQAYWHIRWKYPGVTVDSALIGLDVVLVIAIYCLTRQNWRRLGRWVLLPTAAVVVLVFGFAVSWLSQRWHDEFARHYDRLLGGKWFHAMSKMAPEETRVCVVGARYYPFFGSRRQFRACRPGYMLSAGEMLRYLYDHEATVIAAVRHDNTGTGRYDRCGDWLEDYPQIFGNLPDYSTRNGYYKIQAVDRKALRKMLESSSNSLYSPKAEKS